MKTDSKSAVKIGGKSADIKLTFYNAFQLNKAVIYMLISQICNLNILSDSRSDVKIDGKSADIKLTFYNTFFV